MKMRLHLDGHLRYYDSLQRADLEINLACKERLTDILAILKIPVGEVFITSINGEVVPLNDAWIQPDDHVRLFPAMSGG